MGYNTDFEGGFFFDRPVDEELHKYLDKFSSIRHVKREGLDPVYGEDGELYVDETESDDNIVNFNEPPSTQPGLWCQWVVNDGGTALVWNGGEKFYDYVEWLDYLVANIIAPRGYTLNGIVIWQGECVDDRGKIVVTGNQIKVYDLE